MKQTFLAQLFAEEDSLVPLIPSQRKVLESRARSGKEQQAVVLALWIKCNKSDRSIVDDGTVGLFIIGSAINAKLFPGHFDFHCKPSLSVPSLGLLVLQPF